MRRFISGIATAIIIVLRWLLKIVLGILTIGFTILKVFLLMFCLVARIFLAFVRVGTI